MIPALPGPTAFVPLGGKLLLCVWHLSESVAEIQHAGSRRVGVSTVDLPALNFNGYHHELKS